MKLSFITDEATQDFYEAVAFAKQHGLDGVELRSVGDAPIDEIPLDKVREYHHVLEENGLKTSNLASSFYKCGLEDDAAVEANLCKLERLCAIGDELGCSTIRGFAFFQGKDDFEEALPFICERFVKPIEILGKNGKTLLLESDPTVYTTNHAALARLLSLLNSNRVGAIYDPGNDIYDPLGEIPYPNGYNAILPFLRHVHIKDAVLGQDGAECVKIGTGLVDYPGLLHALHENGYDGWCSLETHYRKNVRLTEEQMRIPQGSDFSAGGMEATAESAEALRALWAAELAR